MRIKKRALDLWVEALRSGDYKQGNGWLNRTGATVDEEGEPVREYCCLGVLCEVAMKEGLRLDVDVKDGGDARSYDGHPAFPPPAVWGWAGADNELIGEETLFARWNDVKGETFPDIAAKLAEMIETY